MFRTQLDLISAKDQQKIYDIEREQVYAGEKEPE
jgi:hypothetical protein